MAEYRTLKMAFWTDPYIEELSTEGKLLYIYLMTCPYTDNLGIVEVSQKRVSYETGIDQKKVLQLMADMERHGKVICDGNYIWLTRFIKHQCSTSPKLVQSMKAILKDLPSKKLRRAICLAYPHIFECGEEDVSPDDTLSIPYPDGTTTVGIPSGEYGTWNMELGILEGGINARAHEKPVKHKYGQFQNVLLTDDEYTKLVEHFGSEDIAKDYIERLDGHIGSKGAKYKSHYITILNWKRNDEDERKHSASTVPKATTVAQQRSLERQMMAQMVLDDRKQQKEKEAYDAHGSRIVTQPDGSQLALPPGW